MSDVASLRVDIVGPRVTWNEWASLCPLSHPTAYYRVAMRNGEAVSAFGDLPRISLRAIRAAAAELRPIEHRLSGFTGRFVVNCHSSLKEEALRLPNFVPVAAYAAARPLLSRELGAVEQFRLVLDDSLQEGEWRIAGERSD